ncbi:hypothetical protein SELMODRAFT_100308 [Selaginella moellendorffii]|uniref:Pentacotripeptide-repeat region of PRORP domain-containing protein n=1 Tax=Selaginella moellendorffii TaxID=88036 RepID=D8RS66_SELML|nr:hypothetical protein SELMODRAFT_100308 [Selaginella moellendorffii]
MIAWPTEGFRKILTAQYGSSSKIPWCNGSVEELGRRLKACARSKDLDEGRRLHSSILASNLRHCKFLADHLVLMYGACGELQQALEIFASIPNLDTRSCNIMLNVYNQNGRLKEAKLLFDQAPLPDTVSWNSMITAYAQNGYFEDARLIFKSMPERTLVSWNTMIAVYCQFSCLDEARLAFDRMPQRHVVSWSTVITGLSHYGRVSEARELFASMPSRDVTAWNIMTSAYEQNGFFQEALTTFREMPVRDLVSWNAMIKAHAPAGKALFLFRMMNLAGVAPDRVAFATILAWCSHSGLVNEALTEFVSMRADFGLTPTREHYCCVVDILARSGQLDTAEEVTDKMPFAAHGATWGSLLAASTFYENDDLAARAAEKIVEFRPECGSPYVLVANLHAAGKRQDYI